MPLPPPNAFANIMSMSHLSSCATHESRRFADQPSHDEYCNQAFSRFRIRRRWHFEVFQKVTCFGMTHFEKPSLATMTARNVSFLKQGTKLNTWFFFTGSRIHPNTAKDDHSVSAGRWPGKVYQGAVKPAPDLGPEADHAGRGDPPEERVRKGDGWEGSCRGRRSSRRSGRSKGRFRLAVKSQLLEESPEETEWRGPSTGGRGQSTRRRRELWRAQKNVRNWCRSTIFTNVEDNCSKNILCLKSLESE